MQQRYDLVKHQCIYFPLAAASAANFAFCKLK